MSITEGTPSIRRAGVADRPGLVRVLGAAFLDDPVLGWLVPDRVARATILPDLFGAFADAYARHDETRLVEVPVPGRAVTRGAALWAPPGVAPVHPEDEPRFGARIRDVAGRHLANFAVCSEVFGAAHPTVPCWFLQFLGIDPTHQGRGYGSVMLRDVLDAADGAAQAAYLEATSERNRALYERHGFRCVRALALPGGPTAYGMWRDPRTA